MIHLMNVVLGLSSLGLACALGYGLLLTSKLRRAAVIRLPEKWRTNLSAVFFSLWCIVILFAVGGTTRILYAKVGFESDAAAALTSAVTALTIFATYHVAKACLVLRKG